MEEEVIEVFIFGGGSVRHDQIYILKRQLWLLLFGEQIGGAWGGSREAVRR